METTKTFILLCVVFCRISALYVTQHPNSKNVSEGQNVTFACELDSPLEDQFRLLWRRTREVTKTDTITINSSKKNKVKTKFQNRFTSKKVGLKYQLYISPVLLQDTGRYYCEIDNGNRTANIEKTGTFSSAKAQLIVYQLPERPVCYIKSIKNSVEYICTSNITGDNIYWDHRYVPLSCLTTVGANPDTVHIIQCNFYNSFGVKNRSCFINNHCIIHHEHGGLLVIGDNATFTCNCQCASSWKVSNWTFYNGSKILSERFIVRDNMLQINNVQMDDNGLLIQCNANNKSFNISSGFLKIQVVTKYPTTSNYKDSDTSRTSFGHLSSEYETTHGDTSFFTSILLTRNTTSSTVSADQVLSSNVTSVQENATSTRNTPIAKVSVDPSSTNVTSMPTHGISHTSRNQSTHINLVTTDSITTLNEDVTSSSTGYSSNLPVASTLDTSLPLGNSPTYIDSLTTNSATKDTSTPTEDVTESTKTGYSADGSTDMVTSKIMSTITQYNTPLSTLTTDGRRPTKKVDSFFGKYLWHIVLASIGLLLLGLICILCYLINGKKRSSKREKIVLSLADNINNDITATSNLYQYTTTGVHVKDQPYLNVSTATFHNIVYNDVTNEDDVHLNEDDTDDWDDFTDSEDYNNDNDDNAGDDISYLSVENPIYE